MTILNKVLFSLNLIIFIAGAILLLMLAGCGAMPKGNTGATGAPGAAGASAQPCTVAPAPNGALITCPDGSTQTINNDKMGLQ